MMRVVDNNCPYNWPPIDCMDGDYNLVDVSDCLYASLEQKTQHARNEGTKRIVKVQNPFLYAQYLLKKAEYESRGSCTVMELFHDTAASKIPSIVSRNLDRRLVRRAKFGKGVSFSPSPLYANKQSSRKNGTERAMIVADVLVGIKEYVWKCKRLPSEGYDTTVGNKEKVYVKFYDNEFYPRYVVYYESAPEEVDSDLKLYNYNYL